MGLVYRAFDSLIRREVAVKTIRDIPEPAALQLFQKECDVLASMSHPNIVEIFDIGEFEEDGKSKPYFVMPLLPGTTLDNLIRQASHRLTVERAVQIFTQTCRGLQAAHERGLVHRDLKPSNIFVMEDDSVKIIDFGVAHIADVHSTIGQKGTLVYMSPEQIEMKPLSALSDIFSLSVVCYEVLTGRQPFRRANAEQIVDAILHQAPPPAFELNPGVNQAISRVVHKGMAKQPWHRFSSARDFAESLNKALRNEPIEFFDPARIRPRLERANRAFEEGDLQFASEILGELQAEGHLDSAITLLHQQIDRAMRQKSISQLLASARARFEEQEDPLALQKIHEILQLEPDNAPALGLKAKIENRRSERQIESWYKLAAQHIENHSYPHAREALQNVLQLRPKEGRAAQLLAEVDRHEQEYNRLRQEKAQLHRAAMDAYQKGEVSTALTKLALVLELDRRAPDSSDPERSTTYQRFYHKVRSEHDAMNNAYAEATKQLTDRAFGKALSLCDKYLEKYPSNALFQALKFDVEEQQRQELSAFIATIDRQVDSEADLDKRVSILTDALAQHPGEPHFQRALRLTEDKRDLVNSIVARAHVHEEQNLFSEALSDWEILRTIYSQYPGLKFEVERIQKRREQQSRSEAKARWVDQIDACIRTCEFARALDLIQKAEAEFPEDLEIGELKKTASESAQRADQAQALMTEGQDLCGQSRFTEGIALLRQAQALVENSPVVSSVLANALLEQAQSILDQDSTQAEALVREAVALSPSNPLGKSLRSTLLDRRKEQFVAECLSHARRYHAAGDIARALASLDEGVAKYPHESRLMQVREALNRDLEQSQGRQGRPRDLEEIRRLQAELERTQDPAVSRRIGERILAAAVKYPNDPEFEGFVAYVQRRAQRPHAGTVPPDGTEDQGATRMFGAPAAARADRRPPSSMATASMPGATPPQPPRPRDVTTKIAPAPQPSRLLSNFASATAGTLAWSRGLAQKLRATSATIKLPEIVGLQNLSGQTRKKILAAGGVLALLVVALVVARVIWPKHSGGVPAAAVGKLAVAIQTDPPGASIKVDGVDRGVSNLQIDLPPGSYPVEAELSGYRPGATQLELKEGSPAEVRLILQPALPAVRISADSGTGRVVFDGQPEANLEEGQWVHEGVALGEHNLRVSNAQGALNLSFQSEAGTPIKLTRPIASKSFHAVVVASSAQQTHVLCTFCPAKLSLDGKPEVGYQQCLADSLLCLLRPHNW
jgi:serine/threonine-protein kinase